MTSDEVRNQKLWDEVVESNSANQIQPYERNKTQLMREYHMNRYQVDKLIQELLDQGVLRCRAAVCEGRWCVAYSLAFDPELSKG